MRRHSHGRALARACAKDPFELLRREGWVAAFPHLGRESASVVVNFMHHFLLYARLQGLHPRRTEMLQALGASSGWISIGNWL